MSILLARSVSRKSRRVALLSAASAVAMVVGAAAPQPARAETYYWANNAGAPNFQEGLPFFLSNYNGAGMGRPAPL